MICSVPLFDSLLLAGSVGTSDGCGQFWGNRGGNLLYTLQPGSANGRRGIEEKQIILNFVLLKISLVRSMHIRSVKVISCLFLEQHFRRMFSAHVILRIF